MASSKQRIDFLFVSEKPIWPLDQGFCIRGYHMAIALHQLGAGVAVSCMDAVSPEAPAALRQLCVDWPMANQKEIDQFKREWGGPGVKLRHRLARFQGLDPQAMAGVVPLVERYRPRAVIGLGQHSPMVLAGLSRDRRIQRVWYAADELLRFQFSCMRRESLSAVPGRLLKLGLYSALEWMFVRGLDAAIGVNPLDTVLLRWVAGAKRTATIRNGVDLNFFKPAASGPCRVRPRSLVIWGRMDFEPNIDAVTWFAREVWPTLRRRRPDARWQIIGKNPHPQVLRLAELPGVSVLGQVDDIRPYARSAAVTILPLRCGGGIKNKLLEAAAMGRPIAASSKALEGLSFDRYRKPALQCNRPEDWVDGIMRLWCDRQLSSAIGRNALDWVRDRHTWSDAAEQLSSWLDSWSPAATPGAVGPTTQDGPGHGDRVLSDRSDAIDGPRCGSRSRTSVRMTTVKEAA